MAQWQDICTIHRPGLYDYLVHTTCILWDGIERYLHQSNIDVNLTQALGELQRPKNVSMRRIGYKTTILQTGQRAPWELNLFAVRTMRNNKFNNHETTRKRGGTDPMSLLASCKIGSYTHKLKQSSSVHNSICTPCYRAPRICRISTRPGSEVSSSNVL